MKDFILLFTKKSYNAYSYIHFSSGPPEQSFKSFITIGCHRYRTKSSSVIDYNTICKPFAIRLQRCGYLKKSKSNVTYLGTVLHLMTTFIKRQNLVVAIFITVRTPPPSKTRT